MGKHRQGPAKPTHPPSLHSLMIRDLGHSEPALILLKAKEAERDPREKGFRATAGRDAQRMGIPLWEQRVSQKADGSRALKAGS